MHVQGQCSEADWVTSVVPQGSVLGPYLFLVMLIVIDEAAAQAQIGSYADDLNCGK